MRRVDGAASYDGIPLPLASDRGENHLQNAIQANRVYLAIENRSIYGIFILQLQAEIQQLEQEGLQQLQGEQLL